MKRNGGANREEPLTEPHFPLAQPPTPPRPWQRLWRSQLFRLALYYVALITIAGLLIREFPLVRRALITPSIPVIGEGAALIMGQGEPPSWRTTPALLAGLLDRTITTLLVIAGAVALAIPVAWTYMVTKRLRFDPGLVRSVVILPIAVAGIVLVVKNSLAIAFSLAGIVAAVRFRNTLKDPRDAVFVFLTIAIGIAAGVHALDVALVVSIGFNLAVLVLWTFQVGSLYGGAYGRTGVISIGDTSLLAAQTPAARRGIRRQLLDRALDMKIDGILLVHTTDPEMARHSVQDALTETARDWRLLGLVSRGDHVTTAEYFVRLAKRQTPADLIGALDEWSAHIPAAEFIPFRRRNRPGEGGEEAEAKDDGDS
ncbi:MAG: DUF4956 domain-containing protein [Longimicrobiales bacterium]